MVWINLILLILINVSIAQELPKLLTKHSLGTLRFISSDGKFAYVEKRPGVLGVVSSFRSIDFISESSASDFLITGSRFKKRLAIEVIPNSQTELNLMKNNKIMVVDYGGSNVKEIGSGQHPKLHLDDEWISYYKAYDRTLVIQNVITQKKFEIRLSPKSNPFYVPDVEMIGPDLLVYSDINDKGNSALIQYNLITQNSTILFRSSETATRMELCQGKDYLAIGEFPYDLSQRKSKILTIKLARNSALGGFTTSYTSPNQDIGNIVCTDDSIYFVKTVSQNNKLNSRQTEAAKLSMKNSSVEIKSKLKNVSQIIEMDSRVIIPFRGSFYVLEGSSNLTDDKLKPTPVNSKTEEIDIDI